MIMELTHRYFIPSIIVVFVLFLMLFSPVFSIEQDSQIKKTDRSFVKSIQSSDGDIIDCVLTHLQPAFDRQELRRQIPLDEPEPSNWQNKARRESELKQIWNSKGESCPRGTIPIRRTNKYDILRSDPISNFGKKISTQTSQYSYNFDEHSMAYVQDGKYYGAKGSLNVWDPIVTNPTEISGSLLYLATPRIRNLNDGDSLISAGWMVNPKLYGDHSPRFFTYFTYWSPNYTSFNACFDLLCSGFVQTSNKIALGGAIAPVSSYNSTQIEISISIWKSTRYGVWWLKVGSSMVGYWPETLFTHLQEHATVVAFGGWVHVNMTDGGPHTSTQMGSGHFSNEGLGKAAYVRYMEVVIEGFRLHPMSVQLHADNPYCYNVSGGSDKKWGSYIFFGGPGAKNNPKCT